MWCIVTRKEKSLSKRKAVFRKEVRGGNTAEGPRWCFKSFKGATKFYFTHYSCVVIVLFNTALCCSAFSTVSFRRLIFRLSALSLNQDIKMCVIMLCNFVFTLCKKAPESSSSLRNSYQKLQQPFRKTNTGQNALSFIGLALWNKVPEKIKRTNLNTFKHNLKKNYLKELGKVNF